jgi:hypothetical protein
VNVVLWILQVLLGIFFVFHAYLVLWPSPKRLQKVAWGRFGPYHF